ncbi:MAG: hypothetical protein IT518_18535 [Burkholderiales bacterium]|nr:hypothetical protein [Burkholderiales bacterium]
MAAYGHSSQSFLLRARKQLDEGSREALFYAALELRMGVEARLKEYLSVQDQIAKAKREGWQVAKLGKTVEATFRLGDRIAKISILDRQTNEIRFVLLYTPVTRRLQKQAQQLGDYLHAPKTNEARDETWWRQFRELLESAWNELRNATSGRLLGAPLLHRKTRQLRTIVEFDSEEESNVYEAAVGGVGGEAILKIEYLDELPISMRRQ